MEGIVFDSQNNFWIQKNMYYIKKDGDIWKYLKLNFFFAVKLARVVEMNQSEFDKLTAELEKLAKFDWYIYWMILYEAFHWHWVTFIKNAEWLGKKSMEIEDDNYFVVKDWHQQKN